MSDWLEVPFIDMLLLLLANPPFAWSECTCAATSANDLYGDASSAQCETVYTLLKVMTLGTSYAGVPHSRTFLVA